MEINRGYSIRGKSEGNLRHWSALLERWSQGIDRYIDLTDGDIPYWYKERANVSFLAGAAWQCGWVAMQEFERDKQKPKGRHKTWKGRCDLYLCSESGIILSKQNINGYRLTQETFCQILIKCLAKLFLMPTIQNVAKIFPLLEWRLFRSMLNLNTEMK